MEVTYDKPCLSDLPADVTDVIVEFVGVFDTACIDQALEFWCILPTSTVSVTPLVKAKELESLEAMKKLTKKAVRACQQQNRLHLKLLHPTVGNRGAEVIGNAYTEGLPIHLLYMWNNKICDEGIRSLGCALKLRGHLKHLDLSSNEVGFVGAKAIAEYLNSDGVLKYLNLSCNKVGCAGAAQLAQALENNESLQYLNLSWNDIGPFGALAVSKLLKVNKSIRYLSLGTNKINSVATEALAEALEINTSLLGLDISHNYYVGDTGASRLGEVLGLNSTLQALNIQYCNITDAGAIDLAQVFKSNTSLNFLDISGNPIGVDGDIELVLVWKTTRHEILNLAAKYGL